MPFLGIDDEDRTGRRQHGLIADAHSLAALGDQSDDVGRMGVQLIAMPPEARLQQAEVAEAGMAPKFFRLLHASILDLVNRFKTAETAAGQFSYPSGSLGESHASL
jgi:hypothetical protein